MSFSNLTTSLQNVLLYQYEYLLKCVYFLFLVGFSAFYLFYWSKQQNPTPFFSITIMRILISALSTVSLLTTPLLLFGFAPGYSGFDFIYLYFNIYIVFITVYIILVNVDILRYGVPVLLRIGKFNINDASANLAYQKIRKRFKFGFAK